MPKKQKFEDDGRVISNMNIEGMPWYNPQKTEKPKSTEQLTLTKGEHRAIFSALISIVLKYALIFVGAFFIIFLIFYLMWR